MKRFNIHFDENWLKSLDDLAKKINDNTKWWSSVTRAALIRLAVGKTYNLPDVDSSLHNYQEEILKVLKKLNRQGKKCQKK